MRNLVERIHKSNTKFAIAVTGGGSNSVSELLRYGGASSTVVDASIPYSPQALQEYLQANPRKCCSEETARLMAVTARDKCKSLGGGAKCMGFGATCSLAKTTEERADRKHWIHIAVCTTDYTQSYSLEINGANREEEETWAEKLILEAVAFHTTSQSSDLIIPQNLYRMKQRKSSAIWKTDDPFVEMTWGAPIQTNYIFPGSFNPIHPGHLRICQYILDKKQQRVNLEISLTNVDKPSIDHISAEDRTNQIFLNKEPAINKIFATNAPKFSQKAAIFPGATFVVGADTYSRIISDEYYKSKDEFSDFLKTFVKNKCSFIVFDRTGYNHDLYHAALHNLTEIVSLDDYCDSGISSSSLREKQCLSIQ